MEHFEEKLRVKAKNFDLFNPQSSINPIRTYFGYFEKIPSLREIRGIESKKAIKWLEANLGDELVVKHTNEVTYTRKPLTRVEKAVYILKEEMLVVVTGEGCCYILYKIGDEARVKKIADHILKFKERKPNHSLIGIISNRGEGLDITHVKNNNPKLNLETNYNDDLIQLHKKITTKLKEKKGSGLIMLHGTPGTGKSTYIRHLIHSMRSLNFIFLPPRIAGNLDSPEFVSLIMQVPNSVLVIEEAEDLLTSRDINHNSNISMLLNMTDGLLGESLNFKVICTFNTNISNIDRALLRKGRLIASYEFGELSPLKTRALMEKLSYAENFTGKGLTLAEIYNSNDNEFSFVKNEKQKIGFMAQVA